MVREKIIFEDENYRVVYKQCPFEEGDPEEYDTEGMDHEDAFSLYDLVYKLFHATKRYALWYCWLDTLAGMFSRENTERLDKFKEIINRPGPFEPGGALYKGKD